MKSWLTYPLQIGEDLIGNCLETPTVLSLNSRAYAKITHPVKQILIHTEGITTPIIRMKHNKYY